jgi:O-antigen ligase
MIKPPNEFSREEGDLLSGRTYLWSGYYYHWKEQGTSVQHLVGFGPDSWRKYFPIYAHNTFVDYLFEYGVLGLLALLLLFGSGLALALRTRRERWKLVAAHLSFIVLNLATMPMWSVEGLILYGLLYGYTLYFWSVGSAARRRVQWTPGLRPAAT